MSYLITHWCDVPAKFFSEERIKEVIDCGINLVMGAYDVEMNRKALEYCEKYGVRYMLWDRRIAMAMNEPEKMEEYISSLCADNETCQHRKYDAEANGPESKVS